MSWIIHDLQKTLRERSGSIRGLDKMSAFQAINQISAEVGRRHGVFLQVNFPVGQAIDLENLGNRDLSILVYRDRKKFEGITEQDLKDACRKLSPVSFDDAGFGWEGLRVKLASGRIDCLPGGVHLWCEITPAVLEFLDWLFVHGYQLRQG